MRKANKKLVQRQKQKNVKLLKKNIKNKNLDLVFLIWVKKNCQAVFSLPQNIHLHQSGIRGQILDLLRKIQKLKEIKRPIALDFRKVKKLDAVSTNYFVHMLHKYSYIQMKGRVSKSNIVRSMLTKLGVHKKLGLPEYFCQQQKVNKWLMARGTSADLIDGYDIIENALLEKFGETEDFYVINEAIGEAVNNVIDHAYDFNDTHREWLIFLAIENDECSVVISDLGKTIPVSLPEKFSDSVSNSLENLASSLKSLDFKDWQKIDDAKRIQLASLYRRTETNAKHRGKGFANMMEVCKQVPESQLYVYSRKGLWLMKHGNEDKMQTFSNSIQGTIIYWSIPIGNPLITASSRAAA